MDVKTQETMLNELSKVFKKYKVLPACLYGKVMLVSTWTDECCNDNFKKNHDLLINRWRQNFLVSDDSCEDTKCDCNKNECKTCNQK